MDFPHNDPTRPTIAAMPACGRQGRKDSHRFFRVKDDRISDQEVFKNELEEGRNSGGLQGETVGGTFGDQNYFYLPIQLRSRLRHSLTNLISKLRARQSKTNLSPFAFVFETIRVTLLTKGFNRKILYVHIHNIRKTEPLTYIQYFYPD